MGTRESVSTTQRKTQWQKDNFSRNSSGQREENENLKKKKLSGYIICNAEVLAGLRNIPTQPTLYLL